MHKLKTVLPEIPDAEYKSSQAAKLSEIEEKLEGVKSDSDELKRLLMHTKSNVFNLHLKFPALKPLYDQASLEEKPEEEPNQDPYTDKSNPDELRKFAEWKRKRLEKLEAREYEEENEAENLRLK